jgi:methyl-accepting chemotaxis protein
MLAAFQGSVNQIIKGVKVNSELNTMLDDMLSSSTKNIDEIKQSIERVTKMIEQVSEATRQQVDAYHNIDVSMGSINQTFYDMLESTDDLVQNGDDILKFTSHLQTIIRKFDKKDQLQLAV